MKSLVRALDQFPPPEKMRNEGRQIKRVIGTLGIQINKNMNAFLRHWGSWTSINLKMNRNILNISIIRIGSPKIVFKSGPFSPYKKPPSCS